MPQDTSVKFDGRTLKLTVCINTDESYDDVVERVAKAAQGPELRMIAVGLEELDAETANKIWKFTAEAVKRHEEKLQ